MHMLAQLVAASLNFHALGGLEKQMLLGSAGQQNGIGPPAG